MSRSNGSVEESAQHVLPAQLLHDLRSPLGPILGYTELLIEQMQAEGQDQFVPYLEKIRCAVHEMLEVMNANLKGEL